MVEQTSRTLALVSPEDLQFWWSDARVISCGLAVAAVNVVIVLG